MLHNFQLDLRSQGFIDTLGAVSDTALFLFYPWYM